MSIFQTLLNWGKDLLIPEDQKIKDLLSVDPADLRDLLPRSPVRLADVTVLFDYQNNRVRTLVKAIKFKNHPELKKLVASYLYEEILELSSDVALFRGSPPILVPMPMSKKEKSQKGFNQCEEIVKEIEKLGGENIEVDWEALIKFKETDRQTTLDRERRILNVRGSMKADRSRVEGKTVLVFDDVYTTLATFSEARRALLTGGAKRVLGIFIAH